ncbi:MAG: DUF1549 domain-containing protein [Gemmataceae bacterium]|nr:DUF1549 domain-containing protein [Gemmataceae bacterium]
MLRFFLLLLLPIFLALPGSKVLALTPTFETDIQPILQAKCARCHDDKSRKGDLHLGTLAGIFKGGESGPAVVSGKPGESLLYEKVHKGEMPPEKKNRLNASEVQSIKDWIAGGAKGKEGPLALGESPNQHDVIPILLRRCSACHGRHRQEAGLDLRNKAAILRGGKSGPAMVVGKPEESLLIKRVRAAQMPPPSRLVEASVKPIEQGEVETLARWIASGAKEAAIEADVASQTPDPLVSDKDRDFWSFRTLAPVKIPQVKDPGRVRNALDAFLLHSLEEKGLGYSNEADRHTLIRRASFDLTGLPPAPLEVEAFLSDKSPDAFEKLIDRLLASGRYGERWGRYWLDLAGYADSEGKREQDLPRPHAWRFRDYVIRSFNADKPYDRFLQEQIAGDELADYEQNAKVTPEVYDNLVATGFLRMAPDATWANITGFLPDRMEVIADEVDILGSGIMGLTLKCARCHAHKFDPIPQRDYYRLLAVFKGAFDEYAWLKPEVRPGIGPVSQDVAGGRHLPLVAGEERRAWEQSEAALTEKINEAKARGDKEKVKALEGQRQAEPRVQALWDRGDPSPTYLYRRGDPFSPGRLVGPGVPSLLTDGKTPFIATPPWPGAKQTGRRLAFAQWLTRPENPLTARVAVNRLFKHHFGQGIVKTLGNFGRAGALPTHPQLLDFLALEFIRQGWSFKAMHRMMMTSAAYRQSSTVDAKRLRLDPDNSLLSRMPMTRMDAEALYDSLLLVAGKLEERRYGPADPVQGRPDGLVTPQGAATGWRRLIYVQQPRKKLPSHLELFDYPQMNPNCLERRDTVNASQALHLLNNGMVRELASSFAERVRREAPGDSTRQMELVYLIALGRPPASEEKRLGMAALKELEEQWKSHLADGESAGGKAHAEYCHAILNSAAFLFVD